MDARTTQVLAATGAVGLGFLLSSCSPPGENPSDLKVDTATSTAGAPQPTRAAADLPGVIDCVGTPEREPDGLSLACADDNDRIVDIEWSSWTTTSATGTATRETNTCQPDCATGTIRTTEDVTVTLSEPAEGGRGLVFTALAVDGETIVL